MKDFLKGIKLLLGSGYKNNRANDRHIEFMNSRLKNIAFVNMLLCVILIVIINVLASHNALGILVNIVLVPLFIIVLLTLLVMDKNPKISIVVITAINIYLVYLLLK